MSNSQIRIKYLKLMWEAEKRLEVLKGYVNCDIHSLYLQATIESEALQLRKLLELIAYSSLISHKFEYESVRDDISKDWHAKRILKKVEQLNPNFYPIPVNGVKNGKWNKLRGGYLTKKQFETLYDYCGSILHSKNPFSKVSKKVMSFHSKVPEFVTKIENLLYEHTVKLAGGNYEIHVVTNFFLDKRKTLTLLSQ